jgi:hypothetical protein
MSTQKPPRRRTASRGSSSGSASQSAVAAPRPHASKARPATFDELIVSRPADVQVLARRLRQLVRNALPEAKETVHLGWKIAIFRLNRDVCGIAPLKDRCNFYLMRGAQLADPDRRLEGTGKGLRHLKVRAGREIPTAPLLWLLRAARELDQQDE